MDLKKYNKTNFTYQIPSKLPDLFLDNFDFINYFIFYFIMRLTEISKIFLIMI